MTEKVTPYRVLARKYRPQNFDDLIGQDVLVRTLSNAFASGRIAHAFLLTGIRGIGKTTTARIIARGLNCIGPDEQGGPTTTPCGECANCKMILDDRHVDVIEMDAASRTGVDDVREIIDSVQYAPTSARYKIYIIDEVHMLSKNAFNALLKTLEEPPAHVKFIFATTELRKIPITILSRCQRFDLKRIDTDTLSNHLVNISNKEQVALDDESAKLIATAAEGSVRDSLSILDQAIALGTDADAKVNISHELVRDMLGLADKTQTFTLLEELFSAKNREAVTRLHSLYEAGIDPVSLLNDLLSLVHFVTRAKLAPELANDIHFGEEEQAKAKTLAEALPMPVLTRTWQMLLKGIQEAKMSPDALAAAEMIVIRIAYAADLPDPASLARTLKQGGDVVTSIAPHASQPAPATHAPSGGHSHSVPASGSSLALATQQQAAPEPEHEPELLALEEAETYVQAVRLFQKNKEMVLYSLLYHEAECVSFEQGRIILHPLRHMAADIPARISRHLSDWTGERWVVTFTDETGDITLGEQDKRAKAQALELAQQHPAVRQVQELFPGAELVDILDAPTT